jgi:ABC-type transport system involved in multi-copper enzyme maturation permease subunit
VTATHQQIRVKPSWFTRFWAVVRYEMLWNIRKKKFIGALVIAFVLATVNLVLPAALNVGKNPYFAATFSVGNLSFILFAIVTGMNSISGEFESGTIVPLLTKPVSRSMVFFGKLFATFIVILVSYVVIFTYSTVGGIIVYGPQNSLYLVPLALVGDIISTFIWVAVVLAAGSISKNSMLALLVGLGLFIALVIGVSVVSEFSSNAGVVRGLNYLPGSGASGTLNVTIGHNFTVANVTVNPATSVSTGTDNLGANMAKAVIFPNANVLFTHMNVFNTSQPPTLLFTESINIVDLRALGVAFAYIAVFLFIAWYAFKRSQILE